MKSKNKSYKRTYKKETDLKGIEDKLMVIKEGKWGDGEG